MQSDTLIYDWNRPDPEATEEDERPAVLMLDDETLRDGLQSPSVIDPPIEAKKKILHLMDTLGIETADVGLPGAGPRAAADVEALCREIAEAKLSITPNCAARTVIRDIEPIVEIAERTGVAAEACVFIGSSPIRQYAEGWDEEFLLRQSAEAIRFAVDAGLPVMYVTEDTDRAHPDTIRRLYGEAVRLGVKRVCVTDTVGHATPAGTARIVRFMRRVLDEAGGADVGIDWHGHRDRGMGLANCLAAFRAGATRVHGCALGIGERCGNAEIDLLLVNMRLLGWIDRDLTQLGAYCRAVSEATGVPIPANYPVVGTDAFETATEDPHRPDERALQRHLLARGARHRGLLRACRPHLRGGQALRPAPGGRGDPASLRGPRSQLKPARDAPAASRNPVGPRWYSPADV
jgi:2-isopropylmalate synthase